MAQLRKENSANGFQQLIPLMPLSHLTHTNSDLSSRRTKTAVAWMNSKTYANLLIFPRSSNTPSLPNNVNIFRSDGYEKSKSGSLVSRGP